MVARITAGTQLFGVWKVQYGSFLNISDTAIKVGVNNSSTYNVDATAAILTQTTPNILAATLNSSTVVSSPFTFVGSVNGTETATTSTSVSGNASTDQSPVTLGGNIESGVSYYAMTGVIYETIIYTTALGTAPRQKIEGYLAWKWGLQSSLPPGHPYKTAAPTA